MRKGAGANDAAGAAKPGSIVSPLGEPKPGVYAADGDGAPKPPSDAAVTEVYSIRL